MSDPNRNGEMDPDTEIVEPPPTEPTDVRPENLPDDKK